MTIPFLILLFFLSVIVLAVFFVRQKNLHIWIAPYLQQEVSRKNKRRSGRPVHIIFCFVDHFEPAWKKPNLERERFRVEEWVRRYPQLVSHHRDSDGHFPQHTFFYPEEEYRAEHLEKLADLVEAGYGEVEVHLHHDNDTAEGLRRKLESFKEKLVSHGLLRKNYEDGELRFGFIHGNWALDNSRKDGRMCGVNNELLVLKEAGCYADFTFPSAPHETQTRKINSIYYAKDDPEQPKSHDTGIDVEVGKDPVGDLMIIQGPLALNWRNRKWGILPHIENGDISAGNPPSRHRIDLWIKQGISVKGREDWVFVKIHTHGTQERNIPVVLGKPADQMFAYLENKYNDGENFVLHYVTAREMFNIVKAAEAGRQGNPTWYRDYVLREKDEGS